MKRNIALLTILFMSYFFLKYCFSYVSPFLFAYGMAKLITRFRSLNRFFSLFIYLVILLILFMVLFLMTYLTYIGIKQVYFYFPALTDEIMLFIHQLNLEQFSYQITQLFTSIMQLISGMILSLPKAFSFLMLVMILTFFLILDIHAPGRIVRNCSPPLYEACVKIQNMIFESLHSMMIGSLKLFALTWSECMIGMGLIGIDHFIGLSLLCALFDSMPLIGVGFIMLPYALYLYLSGLNMQAFSLVILYLIMNTIRFIAEPKIMSRQLDIPFLLHFSMMILCTRLFGWIGFLYSPFICLGLVIGYKSLRASHDILG